jgi:hypothetical protein
MTSLRLPFLPPALAGLVLALVPGQARSAGPDASWLPARTVSCLVVSDLNRFLNDGQATVPGKLLASEALKPFFQGLWEAQENDPFTVPALLGCTLDGLNGATQGSLVLGLLGGDQPPALVLLLDTQGKQEQARQLADRLGSCLEKQGARRTQSPGKEGAAIYNLDDRIALAGARQLVCAALDGYFIASTRLDVLQDLVARRSAQAASLADEPAYLATTGRALKETPGALTSWFLDPLGNWSAARALTAHKVKGQDWLKLLRQEGFAALRGLGGAAHIDGKTGELLVRGYVHAPGPYRGSMRMLTFGRRPADEPPPWVPRDASVFGTAVNDVSVAFNAFGSLFDNLYGEGEKGVFEDVVKELRDDPKGPQVDVHQELLARFRLPQTFLELPRVGKSTSNWLGACPIDREEAVADAVQRLFKGDKAARRLDFGAHGLWQIDPEGKPVDPKAGPQRPAAAASVHKGLIVLASSPEVIRHVFRDERPLAQDADYRRTAAALERLAGKAASVRAFFRLGLLERQTLEELRADKEKVQDLVAAVIRALSLSGPDRPGKGIDFKKLPSPDAVAPLLIGQGGLSADLAGDTWTFVMVLGR